MTLNFWSLCLHLLLLGLHMPATMACLCRPEDRRLIFMHSRQSLCQPSCVRSSPKPWLIAGAVGRTQDLVLARQAELNPPSHVLILNCKCHHKSPGQAAISLPRDSLIPESSWVTRVNAPVWKRGTKRQGIGLLTPLHFLKNWSIYVLLCSPQFGEQKNEEVDSTEPLMIFISVIVKVIQLLVNN